MILLSFLAGVVELVSVLLAELEGLYLSRLKNCHISSLVYCFISTVGTCDDLDPAINSTPLNLIHSEGYSGPYGEAMFRFNREIYIAGIGWLTSV